MTNTIFKLSRLRARKSKVTCNVVHPGIVRTEVTRQMHPLMLFLNDLFTLVLKKLQKTPDQGAFCSVYAATDPSLANVSGKYFVDSKVSRISKGAMDVDARKRLWELSEKLAGIRNKDE